MSTIDYDTLKALAKEQRVTVRDLIALAPNNDPFYTGQPAEVAAAHWFADLWARFGYSDGVHLRRIHYRTANGGDKIYKPDGTLYENTEKCWDFLNNASKAARYLGLVNAESFVDRRNPEAQIHANWDSYANPEPRYEVYGWDAGGFELPDLPGLPSLPRRLPDLPSLEAEGYSDVQQAYHVELWAEKTTMNDVLDPLCREHGANLVTGAGELSITAVMQFMKRVQQSGRPARILYISDFDPAGLAMPISVARKIEFYQRQGGFEDLEICLQPVVLTAAQVQAYRLPRIPVKDTDLRKANFEAAYGTGQVELDALEALHPGELARIVTGAIRWYYDPQLYDRAMEAKGELQAALNQEWRNVKGDYESDLAGLRVEYADLLGAFEQTRAEFADLVETFRPRLEAHRAALESIMERAEAVYNDLESDLGDVTIDLDEYPLPDPDIAGDPDGVLYDSQRDYWEQLTAYKARRNNQ